MRDRYNLLSRDVVTPRRTLKSAISCVGRGLHGGAEVRLKLLPAPPGAGIMFHRTDIGRKIPARYELVIDTRLCTMLGDPQHPAMRVGTVEHLTAALNASEIDDAVIELAAAEVPILDGSSSAFMFLIESAGITEHGGGRERIEVLRPVRAAHDNGFAELHPREPGGAGLHLSLSIDFPAAAIGAQALSLELTPESFASELAGARTFTMANEVAALRKAGLAQGGSLANAIVVDGAQILNPEGLRWPDEFVRHKMLDVVGDMALAGMPISGRFIGHCTGHALNNALLRALFADAGNYQIVQDIGVDALQREAA